MSVAIVDYGSGNLHSAAKAFERAARECGHEQPIVVTSDPDAVARADRVVLPGVGAFADCRRGLDAVSGMVDALNLRVRQQGAVELDGQLAGIVIAHGIAHGDHGRHATLEQRVGRAGVAGALVQRDVLGVRGRGVLRARLHALGHGEEVVPVLHAQDVDAVFLGERKVALVVRRHAHHRAVAVAHQHVVADPDLDFLAAEGGAALVTRVLAPLSVEAISPNVPVAHKELAPATLIATFRFAAVAAQPALKLVWHQGDSKPPGWVPAWGGRSCVFIGEKGMLLGNGKLLPEEKFKDFTKPPETLPRSPGHWVEWVNYAKGNGPVPGSNFQYSGWTTEANHLGNVAYRTGKKIEWDYQNLRTTNAPESAPFIKRPVYRKGWDDILKG